MKLIIRFVKVAIIYRSFFFEDAYFFQSNNETNREQQQQVNDEFQLFEDARLNFKRSKIISNLLALPNIYMIICSVNECFCNVK